VNTELENESLEALILVTRELAAFSLRARLIARLHAAPSGDVNSKVTNDVNNRWREFSEVGKRK
jgi:hypothetical protein